MAALGYAGLCSTHYGSCRSSQPHAQPRVLTFPTLPYSHKVPCHGTEKPASKRQNPEVQKMTIRSWRIPLPSSRSETVLKCNGLQTHLVHNQLWFFTDMQVWWWTTPHWLILLPCLSFHFASLLPHVLVWCYSKMFCSRLYLLESPG